MKHLDFQIKIFFTHLFTHLFLHPNVTSIRIILIVEAAKIIDVSDMIYGALVI